MHACLASVSRLLPIHADREVICAADLSLWVIDVEWDDIAANQSSAHDLNPTRV